MQTLELLTCESVAGILKVSEATIQNWHFGRKNSPAGFPAPFKLGGAVRWRSSDIQKFIEDLSIRSTAGGKIPSPVLEGGEVIPLTKPVRGRGRPRKIQAGG